MPRTKLTGRTREEEDTLRSEALLESAAEVFLEFGFENASTTEIAKRAHASKQTLYQHFSTKEQLFLSVIERRFSMVSEAFTSILYEDLPLPDLLRNLGCSIRKVILDPQHVALLRIVYIESARFPGITKAFFSSGPEKGVARLATFVRHQIKLGTLVTEDPRLCAEHFFSLVIGDSVNKALLGLPGEPSQKADRARLQQSVVCFLKAYGATSIWSEKF